MAQVLDSPLSSPLSTRSVVSINLGSDHRLTLPASNRACSEGAIAEDPFAFQDSEDDGNRSDEEERHVAMNHRPQQPDNDIQSLFVDNSSQLSLKSHASMALSRATSTEVLTQQADFTQMTQDANETATSLSQSPFRPKSPVLPLQVPWGRLMLVGGGANKVDLLPKAPEDATQGARTAPLYSLLGLDQIKPSDLFNTYALGRSNKCEVIAPKPTKQADKEQRLHEWAYGLISNRHCRIYCTLPEDTRAARIPGSSSSLPASSMEVWVEDNSNNGTMINGNILLKRGQKRRLHSGDEISLINTDTLRKKVRDNSIMQKIHQQHSYVFVNVANQQQQTAATSSKANKPAPPIPSSIFPIQPPSSTKRRTGLVNVRAMNHHPCSRSPKPKAGAHRSPLPAQLGYGFAQPTPKSGNGGHFRSAGISRGWPSAVQPAAAPSSPRRIEEDYDIRDLLGRGTCGEVRRAINRRTGKELAVKIVSLPGPGLNNHKKKEETQQWKKEAEILRSLKHPYIVDLVDVFCTEAHLYLVMELSSGGDLFDQIVKISKYSEENSRKVMRRLLSAINYIHEDCQLVHRDLKPENILLTSASDPCDVKITDFGVAKSGSCDLKTFCGTPGYIAPEVLKRRHTVMARGRYGKSADMWSLGVILYILLSGTPPYDIDGAAGMDVVLQSSLKIQFPAKQWSSISAEAKDLVNKLLNKDPNKRLTVQEAMDHRWILMEDSDTHRHPLEDPKLIAITKKRLFSPVPNGPTPVTSAAAPIRKPKAKKRKVSMESAFTRSPSPLGMSVAPIQRPLSPVENRCGSPPLSTSPPASPTSRAKPLLNTADNENDENRSVLTSNAGESPNEKLRPKMVSDTKVKRPPNEKQRPKIVSEKKAKRPGKVSKKDGLVKNAELEDDKICSQFTDEEESISSSENASSAVAAKCDEPSKAKAKPVELKPPAAKKAKTTKAGGSKKAKTSKSSKASKNSNAAEGSQKSQKQATLARWFQVKKSNAK